MGSQRMSDPTSRGKHRRTSWAPVPNKASVSVDVKQRFNQPSKFASHTPLSIYTGRLQVLFSHVHYFISLFPVSIHKETATQAYCS